MAGGWIHNYSVTANTIASPQTGLGGTTPAQAAPMIVATCAAMGIYNDAQPDPKNWMVTTLISKWGVDQLTKNGASISLGKDTVQFVKQPNGVFTPPANSTMTLTQSGSAYSLQQRHGNTFNFDSIGRLSTIVDPYNNSLSVAYLSTTSNLPQTVTDWKGRSLTFNYTSGQLTSVADSSTPNRTVHYGYSTAYNAQGDLTSFTDPESKTSNYTYDTNHDVVATVDANSQLVVSNLYNSQGRITTQYTQGSAAKIWRIFWSGWQTVEQDPAGSQRVFSHDDQGRLVSLQDQLGGLTQTFYDGQNHIIQTISPLNETNQFIYDGNNNLTNSIDPLGFPEAGGPEMGNLVFQTEHALPHFVGTGIDQAAVESQITSELGSQIFSGLFPGTTVSRTVDKGDNGCMAGTDSSVSTRTWQNALDAIVETKSGSTQDRWRRAANLNRFIMKVTRQVGWRNPRAEKIKMDEQIEIERRLLPLNIATPLASRNSPSVTPPMTASLTICQPAAWLAMLKSKTILPTEE